MDVTDDQVRAAIAGCLASRPAASTICPSEAARALAPEAWRPLMLQVRAVAVAMAGEGRLEIRQGGRAVAADGLLRGPIRLGRTLQGTAEAPGTAPHPTTPDGRYFVVRGRLWRKANPDLAADVREALVRQLMAARRALRHPPTEDARRSAREQVDRAKQALGERGLVWWTDGAPDYNRKLAKNTPYRDWYARVAG